MTNAFVPTIKGIFKFILVAFLLILALVIIVTFLKFSEIEKRLSNKEELVDYKTLLEPDYKNSKPPLTSDDLPNTELIMGDGTNYTLGANTPKVTFVEFADFSCPYCKKSFSKIREISIKYPDTVKFIFRDLPIVHDYSPSLALAARCAGEQGLFWTMHDRLFIDQGIDEKSEIYLSAEKSGVEMKKFEDCFATEKYLPQIKKDYSDAQALGIDKQGTPVWFINGTKIAGDIPEEAFTKIIEMVLAEEK
jgi:protein-disulfide isomerase